MAEIADEVKDLNNSLAYSVLDELGKSGGLSKMDAELFKSKYAKLHEFVLTTCDNVKNFLARAKQLNHRLMSEKIRLEKTQLEQQEDQNVIEQLRGELSDIVLEKDNMEERDMMLQIQLSELELETREKQDELRRREEQLQAEAEPQIQRAKDEIDVLIKEIEMQKQKKEEYQERLEEYSARMQLVEEEIEGNDSIYENHATELRKIRDDPERIRKQAEKFESAVNALKEQKAEKLRDIDASLEKATSQEQDKKEREDHRSKAQLKLQVVSETAKISEKSVEDVKRKLEREKNTYMELYQKRVGLDMNVEELSIEARQSLGEKAQLDKQFEKLRRQFKKTQIHKDAVDESLGPLVTQKKDLTKQIKQQEEEISRQKKLLEDIQAEVDLFIGAYLKQESLEKDKKDEYDQICQSMEGMQKELRDLKAEEQSWAAHFKTLASQREKLARDASTAHRLCRETADEVSMKQLEEDDLKKKHQEISQKQKEFCAMYETVKNERNKYMTHIQKSSQQMSEMKEKLKTLQNEVEILRMESSFKDKQLQHKKQEALKLDGIHDQLQSEKFKITAKASALNEQVEQFVIEIDKLNSIINSIEKEMVILRRKYEQAVETRNFTGIQLIDRNDELCILWEKSNIQEKLLKKGEDAMLQKAEELRGLKIDLAEVQRQLHVIQKRIPEVPRLVDEVVRLREQVANVRRRTEELSWELENPKSALRKWRKLKGEDLEPQTLQQKIQDLEERLNDKKEALLEKELILEEVTALSDKLRSQAVDGRQGTMELAQKVNAFQSRIKDVTRKMMATVSELSMYQAQAQKLSKERDEAQVRSIEARERISQGLPPTDTADSEYERMRQMEIQKDADRQAAVQRRQEEDIMNSNFTRTMAEPRVNAYIPDDDTGLPKAYGNNAPFNPTKAGSTMRHIRKPNPKPLEI